MAQLVDNPNSYPTCKMCNNFVKDLSIDSKFYSEVKNTHTHTNTRTDPLAHHSLKSTDSLSTFFTVIRAWATLLLFNVLRPAVHSVVSVVHVVVVTDSTGLSGRRLGGRWHLDHGWLQVWEHCQQRGPEEAEFTGRCQRTQGRHMTDGRLGGSYLTKSTRSNDRLR